MVGTDRMIYLNYSTNQHKRKALMKEEATRQKTQYEFCSLSRGINDWFAIYSKGSSRNERRRMERDAAVARKHGQLNII